MTRNTEKILNADLHRKILEELEIEPSVDAGRIGIAVENGVVTLSGALPSFSEKWAVEKAVKRVRGVRAIECELKVELMGMHRMSDTDIAAVAANVLAWDRALPSSIQIATHDGVVDLTGTVEWTLQRELAEDHVRQISGVRAVENRIHVVSSPLT